MTARASPRMVIEGKETWRQLLGKGVVAIRTGEPAGELAHVATIASAHLERACSAEVRLLDAFGESRAPHFARHQTIYHQLHLAVVNGALGIDQLLEALLVAVDENAHKALGDQLLGPASLEFGRAAPTDKRHVHRTRRRFRAPRRKASMSAVARRRWDNARVRCARTAVSDSRRFRSPSRPSIADSSCGSFDRSRSPVRSPRRGRPRRDSCGRGKRRA